MNGEEFEKTIHVLHERLLQLTATKGAEYTQGRDNRFDNFERQAEALGLTREQVLLVFLNKHLDSITTYVKDRALNRGRKYSEPMTGRVDDAILYLLLLRGMIQKNTAAENYAGAFRGREDLMQMGPDVALSPLTCRHNFGNFTDDPIPADVMAHTAMAEAIGELPIITEPWQSEAVFIFEDAHRRGKGGNPDLVGYSFTMPYEAFRQIGEDPIRAAFQRAWDEGMVKIDGEPMKSYVDRQRVSLDVGGVTTAPRTVEVELRSAEVIDPLAGTHGSRAVYEAEGFKFKGHHAVISSFHPAAVKECQRLGLTPGTSALSAPDQLFGFGRGDTVTFVHVNLVDSNRLWGEVLQRSMQQGFTLVEARG